jgi:histidinol-phosphate aminotransferase
MASGFDPSAFVLPHIDRMAEYTPILPFEVLSRQLGRAPSDIVKLDANENPYGAPEQVRAALAGYPFLHIYPDPEQRELRSALSDYTGASEESILAGHGADELIDLLVRIACGPGDAIVNCPPTFGMYEFDARLSGASVVSLPRLAGFRLDLDGIERAVLAPPAGAPRPKMVFIASPNNPDGGLLPGEPDLARLLALPALVVLDEAYIEFAGEGLSAARLAPLRQNLVVLRTFSKWAGIAGLRLGYGIFPPWLMPVLRKAKQPYNVGVGAAVAGLAALAHRDLIAPSVASLVRERELMATALKGFPFLLPHPSRANFVLCDVVGRDALGLKQELAREGILVRHYARPGLENCIRISAGRPQDTERLLEALARLA